MENNLSDLPDGKIISLMTAPRRLISKELKDAATSEWIKRTNERNLEAALLRQKEIMEYGKN